MSSLKYEDHGQEESSSETFNFMPDLALASEGIVSRSIFFSSIF